MQVISDNDLSDSDVMDFLGQQESDKIRSVIDFKDALLYRMDNPIDQAGICLPFPKTHDKVRLRSSEVSVWFGRSGHYKSALVNQIALYSTDVVRVGIMSFEMPVDVTLERITKQAAGSGNPPKEYAVRMLDHLNGRMWIYDHLDTVAPERALACVHHMAKLGIKLVVIDCLIMVKGVSREAEREAKFMAHLTALAKAHKIHIALVHHPRKEQTGSDEKMPTRSDMRGAGDLADMASTIFIIHNNKLKGEALRKQAAGAPLSNREQESLEYPDQYLRVEKQRNAEFEGTLGLTMKREAMQFLESDRQRLTLNLTRIAA